jgi:hypothetical protein
MEQNASKKDAADALHGNALSERKVVIGSILSFFAERVKG